jgi:urocanate hydratase
LTLDPPSADFSFLTRVALSYATLLNTPLARPETSLGGKLFYAAELDEEGRALLVAANITGAATLAASADRDAQKQALRDGIADFVVTNLDEALRILKNQLRKHETVAVCIAQSPSEIEREMNQRGVAPDLLRSDLSIPPSHNALVIHESEETEHDLSKIPAVVTWRVDSALPKDLALLDEIALTCLDPRLDSDEWQSRRWLHLAPRYLGRLAHGLRLLETHREFNARFLERVDELTDRNEIAFAFEIVSYFQGTHDMYRFSP